MAAKSDKDKNSLKKATSQNEVQASKTPSKSKKQIEEEDDLGIDDENTIKTPKKTTAIKGKSKEEDDDDTDDVEEDTSNKAEEDEDWDPDFDEFDLPKSSAKKVGTAKKSVKDDDEDFKVDDEFKDLFGGKSSSKYDDDDEDF